MQFDMEPIMKFINTFGLPMGLVMLIMLGQLVPKYAYVELQERIKKLEAAAEKNALLAERLVDATNRMLARQGGSA